MQLTLSALDSDCRGSKDRVCALTQELEDRSVAHETQVRLLQQEAEMTKEHDFNSVYALCGGTADDGHSIEYILEFIKQRHLSDVEELDLAYSVDSRAKGLATSLLAVLSPSEEVPPNASLDYLLKMLTVRVSDVVSQARQLQAFSDEAGLVKAIAALVVAGGGAQVPTSYAEVPKAIWDVEAALVAKNTAIVDLQARLNAAMLHAQAQNSPLSLEQLEFALASVKSHMAIP
ncbi:uncharacterized protein JCM15063_003947 [Sporobolomyces koalae]|uniref:uncharacterized protein n=1 Tax=Sporobolomyces koalae TaxID=500713 RepID=UPI00317DE4F2